MSVLDDLRRELPRCGRHDDASHIDCVECMYLSTKVYAPLELIEQALRLAYDLLDGEGYFSDPDYPETQQIAMVLDR